MVTVFHCLQMTIDSDEQRTSGVAQWDRCTDGHGFKSLSIWAEIVAGIPKDLASTMGVYMIGHDFHIVRVGETLIASHS